LDNIIVKEFPHHIEDWSTISLNEFIATFDYVIVLTRENTYEAAISSVFMSSKERGTEHAHAKYSIDETWIKKYKLDILLKQKDYFRYELKQFNNYCLSIKLPKPLTIVRYI
jgi:hypothetical protein